MKIVNNRKIFFAISALVVFLSISAVFAFGLKPAIDFSGGEIFELSFDKKIGKQELSDKLSTYSSGFSLRESEGRSGSSYILRTKNLNDSDKKKILEFFKNEGATLNRYASVGPILGNELKKKAYVAISLTVLAIILFVAWAFREVSRPVSSWKYGFVAILALLHDIIVPIGFFALLGYFLGAEIDSLFVMALLAILGYSVNDTIVIFDRVRERLRRNKDKKIKEQFSETVGKALDQTITRSVNTSLTTALVLLALVLFGADSVKYFALTLLVGVIAGTYSSIFLAAPILLELAKHDSGKER